MLSRITGYVLAGAAALALGGCASSFKDAQMAEATGSDFQMGLLEGYKKLADMEAAEADWNDARVFSDRALAVAGGADVMPENPSARALPADMKLAVEIAQARLQTILDGGGRDKAGQATAMAQVGFDCWLQELEENIQPGDIANCKAMFDQGATVAEATLRPAPAPAPKPVDKGPWEVYFAWNSTAIDGAAQQEINKAYTSFGKLKDAMVMVIGHTDTSGSSGYNQKLSERRANTVYEVLTLDLLIPENRITVNAMGEDSPAVRTGDNVREALNRRVVIRLSN